MNGLTEVPAMVGDRERAHSLGCVVLEAAQRFSTAMHWIAMSLSSDHAKEHITWHASVMDGESETAALRCFCISCVSTVSAIRLSLFASATE